MNTILVPVDFSDVTSRVVQTARSLAKAFGSRLVLLTVAEPEPDFVGFEPGPVTVRQSVARDFKAERQRLEEIRTAASQGGIEVQAFHIQGPSVEKILQEAEDHKASWIVIGSHGHGALYELLVGSVANGVLKGAKCPVVIVPVAAELAVS